MPPPEVRFRDAVTRWSGTPERVMSVFFLSRVSFIWRFFDLSLSLSLRSLLKLDLFVPFCFHNALHIQKRQHVGIFKQHAPPWLHESYLTFPFFDLVSSQLSPGFLSCAFILQFCPSWCVFFLVLFLALLCSVAQLRLRSWFNGCVFISTGAM